MGWQQGLVCLILKGAAFNRMKNELMLIISMIMIIFKKMVSVAQVVEGGPLTIILVSAAHSP